MKNKNKLVAKQVEELVSRLKGNGKNKGNTLECLVVDNINKKEGTTDLFVYGYNKKLFPDVISEVENEIFKTNLNVHKIKCTNHSTLSGFGLNADEVDVEISIDATSAIADGYELSRRKNLVTGGFFENIYSNYEEFYYMIVPTKKDTKNSNNTSEEELLTIKGANVDSLNGKTIQLGNTSITIGDDTMELKADKIILEGVTIVKSPLK